MRLVRLAFLALPLLATALLLTPSQPASAAFHCMRIHAVMGGFQGDDTIQFVELRMNAAGQNFVAGHDINFYDAAGTLKATFTFPSNVSNGAVGDSVLIATSEFNAAATGGTADFVFSAANTTGFNGGDPLHPVQAPGGKVTFAEGFDNCDAGTTVSPGEVDSLAYGGATADWGSPATALPSPSTNFALRLSNLNLAPADNDAEYGLSSVSSQTFSVAQGDLPSDFTTPRNNGRTVLGLPVAVGGFAELPEGIASGTSGTDWTPFAAAGAGIVVLMAGAAVWYRWARSRA